MKQQSTGIVLCALLLTTFGHEILNRQYVAHSNRQAHSQARSPLVSHLKTRDHNNSKDCHWECISDKPACTNVTIVVNSTAQLVAVVNITAQLAIVVDVKENLVGIFDRSSHTIVIFNFEQKIGVSVSGSAVWNQVSFTNLQSLTVYWKLGRQFQISHVSSEITILIQRSLIVLSSGDYTSPAKNALDLFERISVSWLVSLRVSLKIVSSGVISARTTLAFVIGYFEGLSAIVSRIGISVLVKSKIVFGLEILAQENQSYEIFVAIIARIIRGGVDVKKVFGDDNVSLIVLQLLTNFGGNSTQGVLGIHAVLFEIASLVQGRSSIQLVIDVLVRYFSDNPNRQHLRQEAKDFLARFSQTITKLHLEGQLKGVIKLIQNISTKNFVVNGVNISSIITILFDSGESTVITLIVRVLVILEKVVSIEISVCRLLLYIFNIIVDENNIYLIVNLDTNIQIDYKLTINGSFNIAAYIVRGLSIGTIIREKNIYKILSGLPIIGNIVKDINVALNLRLSSIFSHQSSRSILEQIRWIIINIKRGSNHGGIGIGNGITNNNASGSGSAFGTGSGSSSDTDSGSASGTASGSVLSSQGGNGKAEADGGSGGSINIQSNGNGNINSDSSGGNGGNASGVGGEAHSHNNNPQSASYAVAQGGDGFASVDGGAGGNINVQSSGEGNANSYISAGSDGGDGGTASASGGLAHVQTGNGDGYGASSNTFSAQGGDASASAGGGSGGDIGVSSNGDNINASSNGGDGANADAQGGSAHIDNNDDSINERAKGKSKKHNSHNRKH